jgi:hypothetical protein
MRTASGLGSMAGSSSTSPLAGPSEGEEDESSTLAPLGQVACKHPERVLTVEGVPYYRLDPYTGRSKCRTIPVRGLTHVSTAVLWHGPKPYAHHKVYGRSHIRYGRHPYPKP